MIMKQNFKQQIKTLINDSASRLTAKRSGIKNAQTAVRTPQNRGYNNREDEREDLRNVLHARREGKRYVRWESHFDGKYKVLHRICTYYMGNGWLVKADFEGDLVEVWKPIDLPAFAPAAVRWYDFCSYALSNEITENCRSYVQLNRRCTQIFGLREAIFDDFLDLVEDLQFQDSREDEKRYLEIRRRIMEYNG